MVVLLTNTEGWWRQNGVCGRRSRTEENHVDGAQVADDAEAGGKVRNLTLPRCHTDARASTTHMQGADVAGNKDSTYSMPRTLSSSWASARSTSDPRPYVIVIAKSRHSGHDQSPMNS